MNWLVFAGSLAAVFLLGAIAAWLKLGGTDAALEGPEEAMRAAEDALPGFVARSVALGADRRAALIFGENMRIVVLKAHGARTAAREIAWRDVRATADGMLVATQDRFGTVLVAGVDNLDVRRLAPQLTRV